MKKIGRAIVIAMLLSSGCATVASLNDGCAGSYSGVAYNRGVAGSDLAGWQEAPVQELFLLVDLPFSALFDTLLLPYTAAFATPRAYRTGGPGCEAIERE